MSHVTYAPSSRDDDEDEPIDERQRLMTSHPQIMTSSRENMTSHVQHVEMKEGPNKEQEGTGYFVRTNSDYRNRSNSAVIGGEYLHLYIL